MASPAAPTLAEVSSIAQTLLGGMFITTSISIMLYGITTTQAYVYWWNFPDDVKIIRWTVLLVWVLETFHTGFCLHLLYSYVVIDFGNLTQVSEIVWSAGATVVAEVTISAIVQIFFVRRIWILSQKSVIVTAIPAVLLVCRACMSYASGVLTWVFHTWTTFDTNLGPRITVTSGLSFAAATDLAIALTMLYYLQSSRTGFRGTDHLIRQMQSYVVNSGALTMVASTSIVLTFAFLKSNLLFVGLVQIQGKLYANSFLGTLNSRSRHSSTSRSTTDPNAGSVELGPRRGLPNDTKLSALHSLSQRPIEIFQHVTSDVADGLGESPYNAKRNSLSTDDYSGKDHPYV